ncbi:TPA: hypothetical protein U2K06_002811 [Legionella pneumophila]|nr:hypothetical protein [Legionella pneumophila]
MENKKLTADDITMDLLKMVAEHGGTAKLTATSEDGKNSFEYELNADELRQRLKQNVN